MYLNTGIRKYRKPLEILSLAMTAQLLESLRHVHKHMAKKIFVRLNVRVNKILYIYFLWVAMTHKIILTQI